MRLEIVLPDEDPQMAPGTILELAVAADAAGVHTAYLPDHLLPPGPYGAEFGGVYESLVTLAYLAARTSRIRLGTSVLVLPLRDPVVVAKQVATLDRLSGGRALLGVGVGWNVPEFANLRAAYAERGRRTDEAIDLMRALWRGETAFDGPTYGFSGGWFEPRPERPVPIMTGGVSGPALRRAAERADEWQGLGMTAAEFGPVADRIRASTDREIPLGTRIGWTDQPLEDVLDSVRSFADVGADQLAIHLGTADVAADRLATLVDAAAVSPHLGDRTG